MQINIIEQKHILQIDLFVFVYTINNSMHFSQIVNSLCTDL